MFRADRIRHGTNCEALAYFKVERALIIGVETDLLFPIEQQQELADGLRENSGGGDRKVEFARLPSPQGHDSFLVDMDRFRPLIGDFLKAL
jgi:homoserine O-acetyltransferase